MSKKTKNTNENASAAEAAKATLTPVETAGAYLSKEARLVAKVADPETRGVLEKLSALLRDPRKVAAFLAM